jgi:hypothetical protein
LLGRKGKESRKQCNFFNWNLNTYAVQRSFEVWKNVRIEIRSMGQVHDIA